MNLTLGQDGFENLFVIFSGERMYTIGQVSEMFGLPISTLRYYDKQGLFPEMERVSGIRKFSDTELEALRVEKVRTGNQGY